MLERVCIKTADGPMQAAAPVVISASRATDIPAFHFPWFMNRLEAGYAMRRNPFNNRPSFTSFENAGAVVFWTKNPAPAISRLHELDAAGLDYYFLFTLNDYDREGLEPGLPPLEHRVRTFLELSEKIGAGRVVWRFDPICLGPGLDTAKMLSRMNSLACLLRGHTKRIVFSFVQIDAYRKVQASLERTGTQIREPDRTEQAELCRGIGDMCAANDMVPYACAHEHDLRQWGIRPGKCIDDELLATICSPGNTRLKNFLNLQPALPGMPPQFTPLPKDTSQRKQCRCIPSRDIGSYNTCAHMCAYCYANTSESTVRKNLEHRDESAESITGQ